MKKLNKNQNGFGVIELLLILIFIAIVAFIAAYIAHNHKTSLSITGSTNSSTLANNKTSAAAGAEAAMIASDLLNAGNAGNAALVTYVDNHVSDGQFVSSFKTAVDSRTALPNGGASPVACTNGIFPDSFSAGQTTVAGDTAISTPIFIKGGQDVTNQYDQRPQVTLTYLNGKWSVVNYTCVTNPTSVNNSSSTAGFP